MRRVRGRSGDEGDTTTETLEVKQALARLEQWINLEARRDFLLAQAKRHEVNIPECKVRDNDIITELKAHISYLEKNLKQQVGSKPGLAVALLPKIGNDNAGISTNLAKQFSQLSSKQELPFVELAPTGIEFYWKDAKDAQTFTKLLTANGLDIVEKATRPLSEDIECGKNIKDQYKNSTVVTLSHLQAKKLLNLTQYHEYTQKSSLDDWYEARKLDRATCIAQAVADTNKDKPEDEKNTPIPVSLNGDIQRVHYDDKHDIVRMQVVAGELKDHAQKHVLIILDNSGSMDLNTQPGSKMAVANRAVRNLALQLPRKTLLSIQLFNEQGSKSIGVQDKFCVIHRKPAEEIQEENRTKEIKTIQNYFSVKADGFTPAVETLTNSAQYARKKITDPTFSLAISDEENRNLLIVYVTDGDSSDGTADEALTGMRTSNIDQNGTDTELAKKMSYGLPGLPCKRLPLIYPIVIGKVSADFTLRLAELNCSIESFVRDDEANLEQDMENALALVPAMQQRVPSAFVGVTYQGQDAKRKGKGIEEYNLFPLRPHEVFFLVPREAKDIEVVLTVDDQASVTKQHAVQVSKDQTIVDRYIQQRLNTLQLQYIQKASQLASSANPIEGTSSRLRMSRPPTREDYQPDKKIDNSKNIAEAQAKFQKLKESTQQELTELKTKTENSTLILNINKFNEQITAHTNITTKVTEIVLDRNQRAQIMNQRQLGQKLQKIEEPILTSPPLFKEIADYDFAAFQQAVEEKKADINQTESRFGSSPLHDAAYKLKQARLKKKDKEAKAAENIILYLLSKTDIIDLTVQNKTGDTVLHNLAWNEEFDLCKAVLIKAKEQGKLPLLLSKLNKTPAGKTETPLDNMRTKFSKQQMDELSPIITVSVEDEKVLTAVTKLASFLPTAGQKNEEKVQESKLVLFEQLGWIEFLPSSSPEKQIVKIDDKKHELTVKDTNLSELFMQLELAIKTDPSLLNQHLKNRNGETLLMFLIKSTAYFSKQSIQLEDHYTLRLAGLLTINAAKLELLQSDNNGNTALHTAIHYQCFSISSRILSIADDRKNLSNVLKASNTVGLDKDGNGGELPYMNLLDTGKRYLTAFEELFEQVKGIYQKYIKSMFMVKSIQTIDALSLSTGEWLPFISEMLVYQIHDTVEQDKEIIQKAVFALHKLKQWTDLKEQMYEVLSSDDQAKFLQFSNLLTNCTKQAVTNLPNFDLIWVTLAEQFNQLSNEQELQEYKNNILFIENTLNGIKNCKNIESYRETQQFIFNTLKKLPSTNQKLNLAKMSTTKALLQCEEYILSTVHQQITITASNAIQTVTDRHDLAVCLFNKISWTHDNRELATLYQSLISDDKYISFRTPEGYSRNSILDAKGKRITTTGSHERIGGAIVAQMMINSARGDQAPTDEKTIRKNLNKEYTWVPTQVPDRSGGWTAKIFGNSTPIPIEPDKDAKNRLTTTLESDLDEIGKGVNKQVSIDNQQTLGKTVNKQVNTDNQRTFRK